VYTVSGIIVTAAKLFLSFSLVAVLAVAVFLHVGYIVLSPQMFEGDSKWLCETEHCTITVQSGDLGEKTALLAFADGDQVMLEHLPSKLRREYLFDYGTYFGPRTDGYRLAFTPWYFGRYVICFDVAGVYPELWEENLLIFKRVD